MAYQPFVRRQEDRDSSVNLSDGERDEHIPQMMIAELRVVSLGLAVVLLGTPEQRAAQSGQFAGWIIRNDLGNKSCFCLQKHRTRSNMLGSELPRQLKLWFRGQWESNVGSKSKCSSVKDSRCCMCG